MFEVGFTEIVLIFGLALLVLGPEKLPGLVRKVGLWTGRARAMARQLRTQLEHEVTLDELTRPNPMNPSAPAHAASPDDGAASDEAATQPAVAPAHDVQSESLHDDPVHAHDEHQATPHQDAGRREAGRDGVERSAEPENSAEAPR